MAGLATPRDTAWQSGRGCSDLAEFRVRHRLDVEQFTAASILLLEKQGKLSVNDDVRKFIPELPDYGQKITVLHLLNHTSGLRDYLTLMYLAGINIDGVTTDEDALQIIARQKALNCARERLAVQQHGIFLLSIIVKRAKWQDAA